MFLETKKEGETQTEQKPSLAGFVAWLETKNPSEPRRDGRAGHRRNQHPCVTMRWIAIALIVELLGFGLTDFHPFAGCVVVFITSMILGALILLRLIDKVFKPR